jgi:biotin transport system substrate-specific component
MTVPAVPYRGLVLADLVPGALVRDAALVVGSAGFTGLMAQLSFHIPGTPVPVTGQTFAALLVGAALGPWRAIGGLALYLLAGMAGMPWFAGHTSGTGGPSFGYIIGFLVAGAVVGWLAQRGGDRTPLRTVGTMVIGTILIYAIGVPWLAASVHIGIVEAVKEGAKPFLIGDALKIAAAAGLLPACWAIGRRIGLPERGRPESD